MNPLKCTNTGGSHLFDYTEENIEEIRCKKCGASYLSIQKDEELYKELKKAISLIVDACNTSDVDFVAEAIHEGYIQNHRTLQQKCMHAFQTLISKVAQDDTDPRNEATKKWCEKVSEIDAYFPLI